jgi:hypothetical protein
MKKYQVTGNEYISLPTIRESDGGMEGITFLHMGAKGMFELRGKDAIARPCLTIDGEAVALSPVWHRQHAWIPGFVSETAGCVLSCTYLTPLNERGCGLRMRLTNGGTQVKQVTLGWTGDWDKTLHEINETKEITGERRAIRSEWNQAFVWEQFVGLPLFAFAPICENASYSIDGFGYTLQKGAAVPPGESTQLDVFFGLGFEEVAAATSAKELLRQGFDVLLEQTERWLTQREKHVADEKLASLINANMFFTFFYASGKTMDTEELCLMTSRSPRYYVSAAYWDRDSLLWSFPAILMADPAYAKEILTYVFTKQIRNVGTHSRYIDGTVLEPGFELDELCAPVLALMRYVDATGDAAFSQKALVQEGLRLILARLATKRHPELPLYETFLQPTDDMHVHRYLSYDNVLVWRSLLCLAEWLKQPELAQLAQAVKAAIIAQCVKSENGRSFYCWSTDLNGHFDLYDEPPGSLQLLPFYGFCSTDDPVWISTVAMIRDASYRFSFAGMPIAEIGCEHAPHPWVLSICNSLLSGHAETALLHLSKTEMDNGLACESVDEMTGACTTGEAFATCAGFLAFSLWEAIKAQERAPR